MHSDITYSDGVAIAEVVYYAPALPLALYVAYKHGFSRSSGWIFLTVFCIIRIVGAGAQLATIGNPSNDTPYTIALICTVLGLSPLLLSTLGLLSRVIYSILEQPWKTIFSLTVLRMIQVPALVALILCIVGATSADNPTEIISETMVHVGIILFAVVLAALMLLTGLAFIGKKKTGRGEMGLILAVSFALPFLTVRTIYSLLAAFSNDSRFEPGTGSVTIRLLMETLEEMVVVLIYMIAGIRAPQIPREENPVASTGLRSRLKVGRSGFKNAKFELLSVARNAGRETYHGR